MYTVGALYLIEILHQTTTLEVKLRKTTGCILSKFYIKPQQRVRHKIGHSVVSYRNSTSNHNGGSRYSDWLELYLIEILHQTTTGPLWKVRRLPLYLIEILHQTTTLLMVLSVSRGCILSKFYIKPQLRRLPASSAQCCILSKFYIKPQLLGTCSSMPTRCILSKFYIKPQRLP